MAASPIGDSTRQPSPAFHASSVSATDITTQTRWRAVNVPQLVALVRAGVVFEKGVMAE